MYSMIIKKYTKLNSDKDKDKDLLVIQSLLGFL